jgi:hypothetical protein
MKNLATFILLVKKSTILVDAKAAGGLQIYVNKPIPKT